MAGPEGGRSKSISGKTNDESLLAFQLQKDETEDVSATATLIPKQVGRQDLDSDLKHDCIPHSQAGMGGSDGVPPAQPSSYQIIACDPHHQIIHFNTLPDSIELIRDTCCGHCSRKQQSECSPGAKRSLARPGGGGRTRRARLRGEGRRS